MIKGFRFGLLLQLAVGPVCLFIFQTAASMGLKAAIIGVLGVTVVDALYILAAILGIGTLLNRYEMLKMPLHFFGAIIVILFGVSTILSVFGLSLIPGISLFSTNASQSVFTKTMLLTLSNPLTILFWAGVFSTKIMEDKMATSEMITFGLGAVLSTLVFLSLISLFGSFINTFLPNWTLELLNVIVGLSLLGFGIRNLVKMGSKSRQTT